MSRLVGQRWRVRASGTAAAALGPGGALDVELRVAPTFAHDEQGAEEYNVLYIDGENRLFLRRADHALVLRIGGVDVESAPLALESA